MRLNASDLSNAEFCGRHAVLSQELEALVLPIREAVRRYFSAGVERIMLGIKDAPERTTQEFLAQATAPGFTYPMGEHYVLAKDYASWLDGALRLVQEDGCEYERLAPVSLDGHDVLADGYRDRGFLHLYRVVSDLSETYVKWPEMIAMLAPKALTIEQHLFHLPSSRKGRLHSPLSLAYVHPLGTQIRLARRDKENVSFTTNWKRQGRWELADVEWPEWRLGIDKDQCLTSIREDRILMVPEDTDELRRIEMDAEGLVRSVTMFSEVSLEERLVVHPRHRESCGSCLFKSWCHGTTEERLEFGKRDGNKNLYEVQG